MEQIFLTERQTEKDDFNYAKATSLIVRFMIMMIVTIQPSISNTLSRSEMCTFLKFFENFTHPIVLK